MVEVSIQEFPFQFEISNQFTKFPVNLQNSTSLMMSGTQKRLFGPYSENWSNWNSKNLTEFPSGNWNFYFEISKLRLKFRVKLPTSS